MSYRLLIAYILKDAAAVDTGVLLLSHWGCCVRSPAVCVWSATCDGSVLELWHGRLHSIRGTGMSISHAFLHVATLGHTYRHVYVQVEFAEVFRAAALNSAERNHHAKATPLRAEGR